MYKLTTKLSLPGVCSSESSCSTRMRILIVSNTQNPILTARLVLIPTPVAVGVSSYRTMYAELHADVAFCEMALGHHFRARSWTDQKTREIIQSRVIDQCRKFEAG
jgi:hypothetical protein